MVYLPEGGVCVLDHQTVATPADALAVEEKPRAVAVFALVNAPAWIFRVAVARHADRAEIKSVTLRLSRLRRLAELRAQAVRGGQVGLYLTANRADGRAVSKLCQRSAVRLALLNLRLRCRNAQRLFQRKWRGLGRDKLLTFCCGHAYRDRV